MFGRKKKKKQEELKPIPLQMPEETDLPEEDLASITACLPRHDEEPPQEETQSMTPEEALAALRLSQPQDEEPDEDEEEPARRRTNPGRKMRPKRSRVEPAPEDHLADSEEEEETLARRHPALRRFGYFFITLALLACVIATILTQVFDRDTTVYQVAEMPAETVTAAMTPIQSFFASITNSVVGYVRTLKRRANIEEAYNAVVARNEELEYIALLAEERLIQLQQFANMQDEVQNNASMRPLTCSVIGRDEGNYFSTFTINHGSDDGIEPFMAVTLGEALIGYTEVVSPRSATVRTIIDSDASIAGIIQSSRDQGTVKGTLGINGQAMCRMYYLPEDHLPRPGDKVVTSGVGMSFPKGIPIGTVRESTRGMDANKQYIVVEPAADFQHIEYVIVLRYQPKARAVQSRDTTQMDLVPLETARPYPTLRMSILNYWNTPDPNAGNVPAEETETPENPETPTPTPIATPRPTPTRTPSGEEEDDEDNGLEYVVSSEPTGSPSPSPSPSPTPLFTLDPSGMNLEDD